MPSVNLLVSLKASIQRNPRLHQCLPIIDFNSFNLVKVGENLIKVALL